MVCHPRPPDPEMATGLDAFGWWYDLAKSKPTFTFSRQTRVMRSTAWRPLGTLPSNSSIPGAVVRDSDPRRTTGYGQAGFSLRTVDGAKYFVVLRTLELRDEWCRALRNNIWSLAGGEPAASPVPERRALIGTRRNSFAGSPSRKDDDLSATQYHPTSPQRPSRRRQSPGRDARCNGAILCAPA